jgi:hypothetical protein
VTRNLPVGVLKFLIQLDEVLIVLLAFAAEITQSVGGGGRAVWRFACQLEEPGSVLGAQVEHFGWQMMLWSLRYV